MNRTMILCKIHLVIILLLLALSLACNICGNNRRIQAPDTLVPIPGGEPLITCGELQDAGDDGQIPDMICETLPILTNDACQCCSPLEGQCDDDVESDTEKCCQGYECQQGFCKKKIIDKGDFKVEREERIRGSVRRRILKGFQ